MSFYDEIIKRYFKIKFPKQYINVCRIDGPLAWYFADNTDQFVFVNGILENRKLIEIDIKSAFPTICNAYLGDIYPEFIKTLNSFEDKKQKNIFIATSLKKTPYLKQLHLLSKLIILGYIFDRSNDDILLLELKKDGCTILTNYDTYDELVYNTNSGSFVSFIHECNFEFKIDDYLKYLRSNKTSVFLKEVDNNYKIIRKGIYKYIPPYIEEQIMKLLTDDVIDVDNLNKIYSLKYYNIVRTNNLIELFEKYYVCSNKTLLNQNLKYEKIKLNNNIAPRNYLEIFLFPVLLGEKLN